MKFKRTSIVQILLFLVGFFCQHPIISRPIMLAYLGFCLILFIICVKTRKIRLRKAFVWYFIFTIFCMFTLTYTINKINPDYVYIRVITNLVLLFLTLPFLDNEDNIKHLIKGFIIGGLIGIAYVLISQHNLIGIGRLGRGPYGSYAEFGNVCMLTLACFIWLKNSILKNKVIKIPIYIYLVIAILLSGARKALIIPLLMVFFLQMFDRRKKMSKKIMVMSIIGIFSVIVVYASLNNEYLYKFIGYRIESGISSIFGNESEDVSLYKRSEFKDLAKQMFKEKPLLGWGMHGFAVKNYDTYGTPSSLVYCHDGYLEILSCYGLIGFILFYWVFIYIFINYKKLLYDDIGIFLFSYIVIILLMEPYSICFLNSYYILLIGACVNTINKRGKNNEKIA